MQDLSPMLGGRVIQQAVERPRLEVGRQSIPAG